jgi:hypothetical protein
MEALFRLSASAVELLHGLCMVAWAIGLPLLFWRGWPRVSQAYLRFSIAFIAVSVLSHALLGECVLTTLARELWEAAGGHREHVPFVVLFTNRIAGFRPSTREAVLAWEAAIAIYCVALLWSRRRPSLGQKGRSGHFCPGGTVPPARGTVIEDWRSISVGRAARALRGGVGAGRSSLDTASPVSSR